MTKANKKNWLAHLPSVADLGGGGAFHWPPMRYFSVFLLLLTTTIGWTSEALATATINKQFTPATIDPGNISRFRITVVNASLVPLTAAAVTDNLPANIKISSPANATNTCGFTSVTATPGTSQIILNGGTIPAGTGTVDGLCYYELDVVSTVAGNWINTIPKNGPSNGFTPGGTTSGFQATENTVVITNTTDAVATLSVRGLSPPTGSKTFAPSPGLVGEPVTLTIVLTNPASNGTTMPLTTFTDTLPAGMVVALAPTSGVVCTGTGAVNGAFSPNAGDTSLILTGGTIGGASGSGGTCTLSVKVVVNSIGTNTTQTFVNSLAAGAIGNTRGLTSPVFSRNEVINSPIGLAKSFLTTTVGVGQNSVMRIDITNASTANTLTVTSLTDSLPTGLTVGNLTTNPPTIDCVTSGGGTNGTFSPALTQGDASITIVNAVVGKTGGTRRCRIQVPVQAAASGSYVNTIAANAVINPGSLASPAATATLTVNGALTVAKSSSPTSVAAGQPTTFTVTINNWSATAVSGVNFTDTLPLSDTGGFQMVLANPVNRTASAGCSGGTWTETPGASSLTWTGGTIAGGNPGVCTITFRAIPPIDTTIGRTFNNSIPVNSICSGSICNTNAVSSGNVTVIAGASVTKAFSPTSVAQGQTSQLTVTLTNATATPITNAGLTDNLPTSPGNVVVAAVPGTSTTCVGGTVTASAGSQSVSIAGATIPASGNCNFKVNVTGSTVATHTNTIPIGALTSTEGVSNPAVATANLGITTGLTGTKSFSPTSVAVNGVSRVTVTVTNVSSGPLTGVSITDPLGANLQVASPANAATNCAGTPILTATPGANSASLTGAAIGIGGNCQFLFDVKAINSPTNWPNTIPVGNVTSAEGPANTAAITATLGKTATSIAINKSFDPVIVTGGQPSVLRIDITNPIGSPSGADNVSFTDTFPTGIEVYAVPNPSTTCTNGLVTAVPGAGSISLSGATLPANSTCSVFVTTTSVKFLNLINTIPVGAVSTTQGYTNSLATTATLSTLQGLGAAKSFTPTSISAGQTATLKNRLFSTRDPSQPNTTLTGVSFTDSLPAGLTVAPTPNASTDCSGGTVTAAANATQVTLAGATIQPNTNCLVQVDVTASALGAYTNTIPKETITSNEGFKSPNDAVATLNVLNPPVITKAFSPAPVKAGQVSTLTVTITNANAQTLNGVVLTDNLPSGLSVASPPNASTTCSGGAVAALVAGSSIALTNATVPASGACTFQADVASNVPGDYLNTIPANALVTTQGVTNTAPATQTLIVLQPPTVAKSFNPTTINVGATSLLTLTLGNTNASAITLASVLTDTLPGTLKVASPNGLSGTCTLASVTAAPGGNTIQYANGASIPSGGCTIAVLVTGAQAGSYPNVIPASALDTSAGANQSPATATLDLQAVAIGNRVWFDDGAGGGTANDGIQNGSEAGVSGVTVLLFDSSDTQVRSTTTSANGYYFFDNLAPGSYYVKIPASAFGAGQPLQGYLSSTGADSGTVTDLNDNGIDNAAPATNGIRSNTFALAVGTMPTGEDQTGYTGTLLDNSVNATNDFGFVAANTLVAIGNRVWIDNGAGTGGVANDGIQNGTEAGVSGVTVLLFDSSNAQVGTTTTDAGGYYYFDILKPGSYYVRIPASEFATGRPLAGYLSSTGADSGTVIDLNDNGIDNAAPVTNGIQSNTFTLAVGTMPTGEDQTAYTGGLPDANVNATDDFGFVAANTLVAIGNRVWIDNGAGTGGVANDGIQNGTEAGVSGVTVLLFDSSNAQVGTTTTDTDGFYFFDNLRPGSYYVQIPATEFGSGKPLEGLLSSTGADATTTTDLNDNGIDNAAPATNGIRSNSFTLAVGSMPTGEDQTGYTGGLPDANVNATNDFGFMDPKANLVAIGNRVWLDDGLGGGVINNGRIDGTEAGIPYVAVEIYDDNDSLIAATVTDANGRYYFDNLVPGSYYVLIPVSEFGTGRPLVGLSSSTDVAAKDAVTDDIADENGIDDAAPATNGIHSNLFTISVGGEPTDDDQTGYTGVLPNSNVNATDDFGFYNVLATKVAIGNRVWLDDGRSGGVANNGARDGGEVGIDGATVELYNGGGTLITTTTTSGGGYYWFDNLSPGQYYVLLPAGQFQTGGVLAGLFSSTGAGTDEITDEGLDENGRDVANPASAGIRSTTFNLQPGTEVTGELQTGYPGGLPDDSVNGTADFGLVNGAAVLVAIGNRVWLDDGSGGGLADDGVINGTEAGIDGVDVQLYDSANQLIATTVTSGGG